MNTAVGAPLETLQQQAGVLFAQGELEAALTVLDQLRAALSQHAHWHYNRALVLTALRCYDAALAGFANASALGFPLSDVRCQQGVLWQSQGAWQRALDCYTQALAVEPGHVLSLLNRGALWLQRQDYEAARTDLDAASAADTVWPGLTGACWLVRRHLAQWSSRTADLAHQLALGLQQGQPVSEPFTVLAALDAPALQRRAAQLWLQRPQVRYARRHAVSVPPGKKLRVAYFSSDFHDHATLHLLAGVLEAHDRQAFEVLCFSWGPATRDAYQRRAMASVDAFIEVHDVHDVAVADRARALEIDIAIDLKGATHDARPGIFAARAAPLQVSYLGYPGSLGQPWWDYFVADPVALPTLAYGQFSEKIASLPHSYQPNDCARVHPGGAPSRAAQGLPQQAVVLACFNAHYKIGPEVFACWMEILHRIPGAVLWLLQGHPRARESLQATAQNAGIDPQRLVFAPQRPQAEHLARLALADFVLDTWPCNAHTTASDALWMGVPVWTLAGTGFAARVAASLLQAAGLPEWICADRATYVHGAVDWAAHPQRLQQARAHLAQTRLQTPLFDTARYTRNWEAALWAMVQRQRAGLAPAHFQVQEAALQNVTP